MQVVFTAKRRPVKTIPKIRIGMPGYCLSTQNRTGTLGAPEKQTRRRKRNHRGGSRRNDELSILNNGGPDQALLFKGAVNSTSRRRVTSLTVWYQKDPSRYAILDTNPIREAGAIMCRCRCPTHSSGGRWKPSLQNQTPNTTSHSLPIPTASVPQIFCGSAQRSTAECQPSCLLGEFMLQWR